MQSIFSKFCYCCFSNLKGHLGKNAKSIVKEKVLIFMALDSNSLATSVKRKWIQVSHRIEDKTQREDPHASFATPDVRNYKYVQPNRRIKSLDLMAYDSNDKILC